MITSSKNVKKERIGIGNFKKDVVAFFAPFVTTFSVGSRYNVNYNFSSSFSTNLGFSSSSNGKYKCGANGNSQGIRNLESIDVSIDRKSIAKNYITRKILSIFSFGGLLLSSISFLSGCSVLGIANEDFGCKGLPNGTRCMSATDVYWQRHRLANGSAIANYNDLQNNSLASSVASNRLDSSTLAIGSSDNNNEYDQNIGSNLGDNGVVSDVDVNGYQHQTKRIKIFTVFSVATESATGRRYSDRVVMSELNLN